MPLFGLALPLISRVRRQEKMSRKTNIVLIIVGIGMFFMIILFSEPTFQPRAFIDTVIAREIVLKRGVYVGQYPTGDYEGRVAIAVKYPLSLSIVTILAGSCGILISRNNGA